MKKLSNRLMLAMFAALLLALVACGGAEAPEPAVEEEPAVEQEEAVEEMAEEEDEEMADDDDAMADDGACLLYTSPSPRDQRGSRMPSSA